MDLSQFGEATIFRLSAVGSSDCTTFKDREDLRPVIGDGDPSTEEPEGDFNTVPFFGEDSG